MYYWRFRRPPTTTEGAANNRATNDRSTITKKQAAAERRPPSLSYYQYFCNNSKMVRTGLCWLTALVIYGVERYYSVCSIKTGWSWDRISAFMLDNAAAVGMADQALRLRNRLLSSRIHEKVSPVFEIPVCWMLSSKRARFFDRLVHECWTLDVSFFSRIYLLCSLLLSILFANYRLRVRHHSERGTTSLTLPAVDAVRLVTTSKSRLARPADTPARRWDSTTGDKRPRVAELMVLDACVTWRPWPAALRMDSGRELKQRNKRLRVIRWSDSSPVLRVSSSRAYCL